ncbi:MAG: hypothetical protein R6X02_06040 [Enhygromyxa sp.]
MTAVATTSSHRHPRLRRWTRWYVLGWLAGLLTGSLLPVTANAKCSYDSLTLSSPVVIVVDGPGQADEEQERWEALRNSSIDVFEDSIIAGWTLFDLEAAP